MSTYIERMKEASVRNIHVIAAACVLCAVAVAAPYTVFADTLATQEVYLENDESEVRDEEEGISTTITIVEAPVVPDDLPPLRVSCVIDPSSVAVGESVLFAAGSAYAIPPVQYEWTGAVSGTGTTQRTTFTSPGLVSASVTATDAYGRVAVASCETTVAPERDAVVQAPSTPVFDEAPVEPLPAPLETITDTQDESTDEEGIDEGDEEGAAIPGIVDDRSFFEGVTHALTGEGIGTALLWLIIILAGLIAGYYLSSSMWEKKEQSATAHSQTSNEVPQETKKQHESSVDAQNADAQVASEQHTNHNAPQQERGGEGIPHSSQNN